MDKEKLKSDIADIIDKYAGYKDQDNPDQWMSDQADEILSLTASFYQDRIDELDALRIRISELEKKLDDREADLIEAKRETAYSLFEEIICPMCYRLNPQHVTMDNGKGCHYCQEREDWQALKDTK